MSIKFSIRFLVFNVGFIALLFIMCLNSISSLDFINLFFKYLDEMLAAIMLLYVMLHYKSAIKLNRKVVFAWIGILIIGFLSSLVFRYQKLFPVVFDALISCSKFIIAYFFIKIYIHRNPRYYTAYIVTVCKVIVIVLSLFALHDLIFAPFFKKNEFRYITYSLQLMFPYPTYLAYAGATLLIIFGYLNRNKKYLGYMILSTFICAVSLRTKSLGFIMLYWLFYITTFVFKRKKAWFTIIGSAIAAAIVGYDQIVITFFTANRFSPRSILIKDSVALMGRHFPLGTGFGTFGTVSARDFYSVLYIDLGYPGMTGMSPTDTQFLSDSFWPSIFAQFGFFGLLLFIYLVILLFKQSIRMLKKNKETGFAMIMILSYMLVTSLAEAAFFNPASFLMFILYGVFEEESKLKCQLYMTK